MRRTSVEVEVNVRRKMRMRMRIRVIWVNNCNKRNKIFIKETRRVRVRGRV